ncbi:MAG TPA: tRNA (adenosine(37)-N6)-dimethylallyltransferase MiaA [Candidatus Paceibacterota bacterium]
MSKPKVIAVVGPTASGKTDLSLAIAKEFSGEIISADSRQVYRGMDVGTGKISKEEMQGIPHHLMDIANPMKIYTGADFKRDAAAAIVDITNRGNVPIVTGGTFFYLDLLREKMAAAPVEPNEDFRNSLAHFKDEELYEELKKKDPARAETIDPFNRHRLIRALEIIDALGSVPPNTTVETPYDWLIIGIDVPTESLHQKIHDRLHKRLSAGMIEEVEQLHGEGITWERFEDLGLEYRYIARYLAKKLTYEEMVTELETKIRHYAKRQMTWLKKDEDIEWFSPEKLEVIYKRVKEFLAE